MVVWLSGHASLPAGFSTLWACIRAVRARLPALVQFFPSVSLARAHTDATTYTCVNANTHACASSPRAEDELLALHDQNKADLLSLSCGRRSETAGAPCKRVSTRLDLSLGGLMAARPYTTRTRFKG